MQESYRNIFIKHIIIYIIFSHSSLDDFIGNAANLLI